MRVLWSLNVVAILANVCIALTNVPQSMSPMTGIDFISACHSQQTLPQVSYLAYVDSICLATTQFGRGQPSNSLEHTCVSRPLVVTHESQFVGRPAPSLSSLHRAQNRNKITPPISMRKRKFVSMQTDSFDPLGLASGVGSVGDVDIAIVQKQLWDAAKVGDTQGMVDAIKAGANANFKYPEEGDAAAVQCAALHGNSDAVAMLVTLGADVNVADKFGWTPLHDAALNGHTATVAKLVELGAHVDAKTIEVENETPGAGGRTAMTNAAMNGHTDTVKKLVSFGADVHVKQKDGWTALHLAAKNGWDETVDELVKLGIDVNVKNEVDMTALHYAAWDATIETCQKLIALGINVEHKALGQLSALDLAERRTKEKAGRQVAEALRDAMRINAENVTPAESGGDSSWNLATDEEWRKLIKNHPYAQSSDGLDF